MHQDAGLLKAFQNCVGSGSEDRQRRKNNQAPALLLSTSSVKAGADLGFGFAIEFDDSLDFGSAILRDAPPFSSRINSVAWLGSSSLPALSAALAI